MVFCLNVECLLFRIWVKDQGMPLDEDTWSCICNIKKEFQPHQENHKNKSISKSHEFHSHMIKLN